MNGSSDMPLWEPSVERVAASHLTQFQAWWQARVGREWDGYAEMHQHSVDAPAVFWNDYLSYSGLPFAGACDVESVIQGTMPTVRWFAGVTTNYAQAALYPSGINDDDIAIISTWEGAGEEVVLSYAELRRAVAACAAAMRAHGVGKGERVAALVSNTPEAIIILLACASIGAVFSSCSPDFGYAAAQARFGQIAPKLLFAHAGYAYGGKWYDVMPTVQALTESLTSVTQTVVIKNPNNPNRGAPTLPRAAMRWEEWMALSDSLAQEELEFAALDFDHPLYILFSSGTTGVPKAIVHRTGGVMLKHHSEHRLHSNLSARDRVLYFTTCGWMMWNWLVSGLLQGSCVVLYDGSPAYPQTDSLWQAAARLRVNFVGTSARYIHACRDSQVMLKGEMNTDALNTIAVTGSPLSEGGFRWVYSHGADDVHLCVISGGTDIVGCFLHGNVNLPVSARQMQVATMGCDIAAYSPDGAPLLQEVGELVCRSPVPSMPLQFWNDESGEKYRAAYFNTFPNVWHHGDLLEITAEGGYIIHGRSDATLNPSGVRIGTAEIYQVLDGIDGIVESAAVAKYINDEEQVIWLFVVLASGRALDDSLVEKIKKTLRAEATARHVPQRIFAVSQLPQTRSGKMMEVAITQAINGKPVSNRSAMMNPEALDEILAHVGEHKNLE